MMLRRKKLPKPGLFMYNGDTVVNIDDIPTVLKNFCGNFATGYTIESDMTTKQCVVAKGNGFFAHGTSTRDASAALQAKILSSLSVEDKIAEFSKKFKLGTKYPTVEFYNWHNLLTGSCKFGRDSFAKSHSVDLEGEMTTEEFFELVRNAFGWENIKKAAESVGYKVD